MSFTFTPIGFVRSPFLEKVEAPRQAVAPGAAGVEAFVDVLKEHEHALADLEGFERIWLLFWFHEAKASRAKVLPPRSDKKRGVFATRSPHRPNPIGISAVRLVRVSGLTLHVCDVDLLDGTPIVDIKPYIPYADSFPDANAGWLESKDPRPAWQVVFDGAANEQLEWLACEGLSLDLRTRIVDALVLGPAPHPYRRIKKVDDGLVLAVKEWRAAFHIDETARTATVARIRSGFRAREIHETPLLSLHRAFVARFG
jgi:tRNA-Thr(GGU) m(6)t(6)A37 methyltransferase TsaA